MLFVLFGLLLTAPSYAASVGGSGGGVTGWPSVGVPDEITWALSEATSAKFGDGTRKLKVWGDSTNGVMIKPDPLADSVWRCWTNFNCIIRDEENGSTFATIDPDSIGAGSGTFTMATSQQMVLSNFGVEFNESDTNPTCSSNNYNLYADTSEASIKQCSNGTAWVLPRQGFVRKLADETVNTNATAQNDDELLFSLAANSFYTFRIQVIYSSGTTPDFRYDVTLPASATGWKSSVHPNLTATACTSTSTGHAFNDVTVANLAVGGAGAGLANACFIEISGQVTTAGTAGTFQFQWAQNTSDASDTVVHAGSNITWIKW